MNARSYKGRCSARSGRTGDTCKLPAGHAGRHKFAVVRPPKKAPVRTTTVRTTRQPVGPGYTTNTPTKPVHGGSPRPKARVRHVRGGTYDVYKNP